MDAESKGRKFPEFMGKLVLFGITLSAFFWIADSVVDAYIFQEGSIIQTLIAPEPVELWMRLLICVLIVSLSYFAQTRVTEQERAKEEIRKHRDRLEELVAERTAELQETVEALEREIAERKQANEALMRTHKELRQTHETMMRTQQQLVRAEKLAAVGRLTTGVSHEILNPLNIITMSFHIMANDPATPPKIVGKLRVLSEQANRIANIAHDLLSFARQRPPERRLLDLNHTVQGTMGLLEREFELDNIDVELKLAEELPPVLADEDQLQQVILNLLTNARDAMPEGGRLVLRTESVRDNGRDFVELWVEDTGPGIPPEDVDNVFDPFFTTKPEGEGTGLGLSIVHGIVESHGGSVRAENVPGGGAAFTIRLGVENG